MIVCDIFFIMISLEDVNLCGLYAFVLYLFILYVLIFFTSNSHYFLLLCKNKLVLTNLYIILKKLNIFYNYKIIIS